MEFALQSRAQTLSAPGGQPWCRGSPWSPGCRGMPAAGLFRPAMPTSKPAMAGLVQELGYQNRRFCYPSNILGVQVIDLDTQDLPPAGSHGVAGHHGRRGAGESPRPAFSGQPCPQSPSSVRRQWSQPQASVGESRPRAVSVPFLQSGRVLASHCSSPSVRGFAPYWPRLPLAMPPSLFWALSLCSATRLTRSPAHPYLPRAPVGGFILGLWSGSHAFTLSATLSVHAHDVFLHVG